MCMCVNMLDNPAQSLLQQTGIIEAVYMSVDCALHDYGHICEYTYTYVCVVMCVCLCNANNRILHEDFKSNCLDCSCLHCHFNKNSSSGSELSMCLCLQDEAQVSLIVRVMCLLHMDSFTPSACVV